MPVQRTRKRRFRARPAALGLSIAMLGVGWLLAAMPASAQQMQHDTRPGATARTGENAPQSAKPAARDQLMIVGSTSMDAITSAVIHRLTEAYQLPKPIIRLEGTRAGIKEFCAGVGPEYPDIVAATDRMSKGEFETCVENKVLDIVEVDIGDSAVVVVAKKGDQVFNLTPRMVYYGLAEDIPIDGEFKTNKNKTWKDTDKEAPEVPINVIAPGRDFGTRRYFDDNFMQGGCRHVKEIDAIFSPAERVPRCVTPRDDGPFVEVAEDQVVNTLIKAAPGTLGIVAWMVYLENQDKLEALPVNGVIPTHESIDAYDYTMSSTLRYYFKRAHMRERFGGQGVVKGIWEFMNEAVNDEASAEGGYLEKIGMVALSPEDRRTQKAIVRRLKRFAP